MVYLGIYSTMCDVQYCMVYDSASNSAVPAFHAGSGWRMLLTRNHARMTLINGSAARSIVSFYDGPYSYIVVSLECRRWPWEGEGGGDSGVPLFL